MSDASSIDGLSAQVLRSDDAAQRIEREIAEGNLGVGDRLLGERELAQVLGVSRVTVRRALAKLRSRGLVKSDETRGWFVEKAAVKEQNVLRSFTELADLRGMTTRSQVISRQARESTIEEAELFDIEAGATMFEIERIRFMDAEPIAIEVSRVPQKRCPNLADADLENGSLHAELRQAGAAPVRADYSLTAKAATAEEAAILKIAPEAPLLVANAIVRDAGGDAVEISYSLFRADRYSFNTTLSVQ